MVAKQEVRDALASLKMQESLHQIIHDEDGRVNPPLKTDKSSEHPRTFSDEASELSEIKGASLDRLVYVL